MEPLDTLFEYLPDYRIAICRVHCYGVLASQLPSHLKRSHGELTAATRRAMVSAAAAQFPAWATSPDAVVMPPPTSHPLAQLPVYKDGMRCGAQDAEHGRCGYIARTLQDIQQHYRKLHSWTNPRKRGRPYPGEPTSEPWARGVWCQKFQLGRQLARLFEVSPPQDDAFADSTQQQHAAGSGGGSSSGGGEDADVQRALEASFLASETTLKRARQDADARIRLDDNRYIWHRWLKRTRWARHLAGFDRQWLLRQTQRPDESKERDLFRVCWALEAILWKAQRAASPDVVGLPAATYIERREVGAPDNESPFNAAQAGKTMKKYSGYWVAMISYIWRTHKLPPAAGAEPAAAEPAAGSNNSDSDSDNNNNDDDDDDNNNNNNNNNNVEELMARHAGSRRPQYMLTGGQMQALWQIEQTLAAAQRDSVLQRSSSSSSSSDDSSDDSSDSDGSHFQPSSDDNDDDDDDVAELSKEREEKLERHVLQLLIALLDHDIKDEYYRSPLISATAALGVDRHSGWKTPLNYTTLLSAIVTVSKMLVLYGAVQARKQEVVRLMSTNGHTQADAEGMATSHFELVQDSVGRFMTLTGYGGTPSPLDWVLRLRAYGKKTSSGTNTTGFAQWVGDTLIYGNLRYSMPQLRSMIHGLVQTTRMELVRDLLLLDVDEHGSTLQDTTALPPIAWDEIVDNPAELRAGWSFLQDPRNTFGGVDGRSWLSKRVGAEKKLCRAFVDINATRSSLASGGAVVWKASRVQHYQRAMRQFREHLLVAMHMTGGQPARGTELVTVTHVNQPNGESRGVFVENGLMVFVTMYHKGIGQSGKAKVIHRYLPREVGELLFYHLWLVLPFWQQLEGAAAGYQQSSQPPSPFLWEPIREKAWTGPRRQRDKTRGKTDDRSGEKKSKTNSKATRPGAREERWGTNQVRRAIERASLRWLKVKLNIQIYRQNAVAIVFHEIKDPAVLQTVGAADNDAADNDAEDAATDDNAFALQTTHTVATEGQVYGRPADESPFSIQARRVAFRRVSIAWHRFLQFDSTLRAPVKPGSVDAVAQTQAKEEQYRRWKQMRATDLDASLARLQGKGARFRGCQRAVLEAVVLQQRSPVVAVMPTGVGKSLIFMLPALTSTGVTVVVVPLLALKSNLWDRCIKAGIDAVEWSSEQPHEWANVVLVVPEAAVGAPFQAFLHRQHAMGRLDRIVVDECHIVLESTKGWRTQVLHLRRLVHASTQLVYLTATLKPSEESEFLELLALPPKNECTWFRSPTTRPNVAYRVHRYNTALESEGDVLEALVRQKLEQHLAPGQIIVYCDSRQTTERYAARLNAVCFHREVTTPEQKLELLRQLTNGTQRVFVATSALGLGIDCDTIRVVIFVGSICRLRDFVQMSGRGGRDGAPSEAIVVRGTAYNPDGVRRVRSRFADVEQAVHNIVEGDGCVRVILDREMDGDMERRSCRRGEEVCSHCEEQMLLGLELDQGKEEEEEGVGAGEEQTEEQGKEKEETRREAACRVEFEQCLAAREALSHRETEQQAREAIEVQLLKDMLWEWKDRCQWCYANSRANAGQHTLAACVQEEAASVRSSAAWLKQQLQWERFSCCFDCGVPQSLCSSYQQRPDAGWEKQPNAPCRFAGVLIASMASIWVQAEQPFTDWVHKTMVASRAARADETIEVDRMLAWLGTTVRWGGIQSNRLCRCFVVYWTLAQKKRNVDEQESYSWEWQQVQELFDELRSGCVACCLLGNPGGYGEWQKHKTMQCEAHAGMTGMDLDRFRQGICDRGGVHSCRRCWVSQKYCATGESMENRCQWPNVVVPLARTAAMTEAGEEIIRERCGYAGKLEEDWGEYAGWLGKQHKERVWGEFFSNAMVVGIRVALEIQEGRAESGSE